MDLEEIKSFLDEKVFAYNAPSFVHTDPISIPKQFTQKEDIEIAGFIVATISWGQRTAIIKSGNNILSWMDYEPYQFVMDGNVDDLPQDAVYRTFNGIDLKYFILALRNIYQNHGGLEHVFTQGYSQHKSIKEAIIYFREVFTSFQEPNRSGKHLANAAKGSSCKRVNMYLRWMVRHDNMGVDFGLWEKIDPSHLMLPLDVHTGNVGRKLGLLERKQSDWKAVEEITLNLRKLCMNDPIKYDFALFGLGVFEKF